MNPVWPNAPHEGAESVEFAKDQPEYQTLPAFRSPDGLVQTEWEFTDEEREQIANGGRLRLWTHTFRRPFQPVQLEIVE